ncbi:LLM class flavin-dependent oxidoreductase [Paenibacillus hamazuiensis]|uniref:LLM class flavin-dependent oxidoreductase n=1 Tax=Paenibacillus hamazuiensis TaxID=2936508 RepID=UPI0020109054|nr:LLM class flavin-dependent oxidoreductase [Paenibacillus hamazuiensis]
MAIRLSILDQSPIGEGEDAADALRHTVQLAQRAEQLGFTRFWVSEHHDSDRLAGSSPEVLIAYLLAKTSRIRIGSGGVMLQHYSPYKVAENFHVLASLEPGRVDLGIGRAPGGLPRSTRALQDQASAGGKTLDDKLEELQQYLRQSRLPAGGEPQGVKATPLPPVAPDLYLLGASTGSAELAARLGVPYVFSQSLTGDPQVIADALRIYRTQFRPGTVSRPETMLALTVILTDTDEEAERLAAAQSKVIKIRLASGRTVTVRSVEQAEEFGRQAGEPYTLEEKQAVIVHGGRDTVRRKLSELRETYGLDEFVVTVSLPLFEQRLRAIEQLHEVLGEQWA